MTFTFAGDVVTNTFYCILRFRSLGRSRRADEPERTSIGRNRTHEKHEQQYLFAVCIHDERG